METHIRDEAAFQCTEDGKAFRLLMEDGTEKGPVPEERAGGKEALLPSNAALADGDDGPHDHLERHLARAVRSDAPALENPGRNSPIDRLQASWR